MDNLTENLETPVDTIPEKPWYASHSMWAAIMPALLGFLTILKVPQPLVDAIGATWEQLLGALIVLTGVWGVWAAATRKTTLTSGRTK